MVRVNEFKKAAAERLRALFPQVVEWQESLDATVGDQTVDLLVKLRMGQEHSILICETRSRGNPGTSAKRLPGSESFGRTCRGPTRSSPPPT